MESDTEKTILVDTSQENDFASNGFPAGLRVLVVDDDRTCLLILEKMLQNCLYQVTKCRQAKDALSLLREDKDKFDIVISDLHMPDMDGFRLLEIAQFEMGLPVVMMSSDDDRDVVLKGVLHGACDYLIKPIRMEALKILWQHVVRKKTNIKKASEQPRRVETDTLFSNNSSTHSDKVPENKCNGRSSKRRKIGEDDCEALNHHLVTEKKRMIWTKELNDKFITAVTQLGPQNAVPLKILEYLQKMNVIGVTREHVASHLQKYRMNLRKLDEVPRNMKESIMFPRAEGKYCFQQSGALDGCNQQFYDTRSQFPLPGINSLQASGPARPNSMSFDSQTNLLHPKMLDSSYCSITKSSAYDFPVNNTFAIDPSGKNVNEYGNLGSIGQSSQIISVADTFDDFYDSKGDDAPPFVYESSFCYQHLDPNEIFLGSSTEVIKYNGATQFDKIF